MSLFQTTEVAPAKLAESSKIKISGNQGKIRQLELCFHGDVCIVLCSCLTGLHSDHLCGALLWCLWVQGSHHLLRQKLQPQSVVCCLVCVCVCACMHVCVSVCVHACMCVCVYVHMYIYHMHMFFKHHITESGSKVRFLFKPILYPPKELAVLPFIQCF